MLLTYICILIINNVAKLIILAENRILSVNTRLVDSIING
nr:MAG TPA: hypothetical protein [Caudoviricetes sp.]